MSTNDQLDKNNKENIESYSKTRHLSTKHWSVRFRVLIVIGIAVIVLTFTMHCRNMIQERNDLRLMIINKQTQVTQNGNELKALNDNVILKVKQRISIQKELSDIRKLVIENGNQGIQLEQLIKQTEKEIEKKTEVLNQVNVKLKNAKELYSLFNERY